MTERKVTTIPASISRSAELYSTRIAKRRVAGYARVSTDHDEQLTSYQAQVDYYTRYIKSRDDWEFAGMYTDEGISATNTHRREGFKAMLADAKAGKIDLIITKSVSRFARNTVDSLTAVRELKSIGVEIYFEKENIWTLDSKGELLITIMSSLAQEESRSISENVTWGHRKRFADGKAMIPFSNVLGFERGEDGQILVNQEQAVIVKMIFRMFLEGMTPHVVFIPYQEKEDLIYSFNAGDVHWCVNAKGIKGVSCPSKAYGIMAAGKPILGVLESGTEVRGLIEDSECGKCCEPGDYVEVADLIRWYIENAGTGDVKKMGQNGRKFLEENLTKDISVDKYINEIKKL